ncbi:MAG: hypothetical protein WC375_06285 [Methanomassiliicoccales archaeon]|jgi:glycosyltransferase involved in cell wall biosynthesis
MANINDITLLITACKPHLVELCLTSVKRHYPELPVIICLPETEIRRNEYLVGFKNVSVIVFTGFPYNHHNVLNNLIEACPSKYCIICDDDVFFHTGGIIECISEIFKHDVSIMAVAELEHIVINFPYPPDTNTNLIKMPRLSSYFAAYDVSVVRKYNLQFAKSIDILYVGKDAIYDPSKVPYYDTGAKMMTEMCYHGLKWFDMRNYSKYITHYSGASRRFIGKLNPLFYKIDFLDLAEYMFDTTNMCERDLGTLRKLLKDCHSLR